MMRRNRIALLVAVAVLAAVFAPAMAQNVPPPKSKDVVTVTVTGQGMDLEEAKNDARRKAVEQGAGQYIYSQSQTKDFVLVKDTVLARSAGFVQSLEILSQRTTEDDVLEIKCKAVVSVQGIVDTCGVVTNLLEQMGRPKIMVSLTEKIGGVEQEDSTVQTRIENLLIKSGFLLVDKKQINAIDKKEIAAAIAENKPEKIQAIAKRYGAQIFITGSTNATPTGANVVHGLQVIGYGADGDIKCYRSDTAALMASQNGRANGFDQNARLAAKKSLEVMGERLGPAVLNDILRFWQDALEGRGEVILEVDKVENFAKYVKLKKELEKVKGVKSINGKFANNVARFEIQSDARAEKLAERMVESVESVEITDVSQNVIKGTLK